MAYGRFVLSPLLCFRSHQRRASKRESELAASRSDGFLHACGEQLGPEPILFPLTRNDGNPPAL